MFKKVLVANRGEIAARVLATCRRLGIRTVAVYSDADREAPHVALADEAVRLGGAPVRESYLNVEALLDAIRSTAADAVHPGYGLLSESPEFAARIAQAKVTFIGPSPDAMRKLGDKAIARELAKTKGLSPPPGSEGLLGCEDDAVPLAAKLGYPVLVKAAAGGGGIGMQIAHDEESLRSAVQTCARRAEAAFSDARVYLEKYLETPRHIELQTLRDASGNALCLGERECSVQRRHQKVLEESPSAASFLQGGEGRTRLDAISERALGLLHETDYRGVATVEFVADASGAMYFLEVNTRLQVEHPVTETRFGVDLVQAQLEIASGLGFSSLAHAAPSGHSIEARIYAEDPAKNFMPQPGTIARCEFPELDGVRVDSGIREGYEVTPHYDPLLAKVIAHAEDRRGAIAKLDEALGKTILVVESKRGQRATNLQFLRAVLGSREFASGDYDTSLAEHVVRETRA